jgi:lysophospholipase L1-like esterase
MGRALGDDWAVIEQGLPGRTTCLPDPMMGAHMDGVLGLRIALESHGPIDLLTIMLGTNDAQYHHARSAEQIVGGIGALVALARSEVYQTRHDGFDILLIAPPPVLEQGTYKETAFGAAAKSQQFATLIGDLAAHWDIAFMDAAEHIGSSPIDGIHFAADDHQTLGNAIAAKVASL